MSVHLIFKTLAEGILFVAEFSHTDSSARHSVGFSLDTVLQSMTLQKTSINHSKFKCRLGNKLRLQKMAFRNRLIFPFILHFYVRFWTRAYYVLSVDGISLSVSLPIRRQLYLQIHITEILPRCFVCDCFCFPCCFSNLLNIYLNISLAFSFKLQKPYLLNDLKQAMQICTKSKIQIYFFIIQFGIHLSTVFLCV